MIYFSCSKCGEALEAPDSMTGELLQCPKCRFPEKIPNVKEQAAPIEIEGSEISEETASTQIRSFKTADTAAKREFKRPLIKAENGATRVRTFHIRLSEHTTNVIDDQINKWIDENPDISVKFTNTTVGEVEGKTATRPHLIVTVWY